MWDATYCAKLSYNYIPYSGLSEKYVFFYSIYKIIQPFKVTFLN